MFWRRQRFHRLLLVHHELLPTQSPHYPTAGALSRSTTAVTHDKRRTSHEPHRGVCCQANGLVCLVEALYGALVFSTSTSKPNQSPTTGRHPNNRIVSSVSPSISNTKLPGPDPHSPLLCTLTTQQPSKQRPAAVAHRTEQNKQTTAAVAVRAVLHAQPTRWMTPHEPNEDGPGFHAVLCHGRDHSSEARSPLSVKQLEVISTEGTRLAAAVLSCSPGCINVTPCT